MQLRLLKYLWVSLVTLICTLLVFASSAAARGASSEVNATQGSLAKAAATSFNWSGYAATGQTFNRIQAVITVPSVSCTVPYAQSLYWVGLDGYNTTANQTVEQDGVGARCSGGQHPSVSYFAWWEMFQTSQNTGLHTIARNALSVKPGDKVQAMVTYNPSNNGYVLQLNNLSTKQLFATTQYCIGTACQRQSAEWVAERYMLAANTYTALAKWNTEPQLFTSSDAGTVKNTALQPIGHFRYTPINMISQQTYDTIDATGTLLRNGNAFTVTWEAAD